MILRGGVYVGRWTVSARRRRPDLCRVRSSSRANPIGLPSWCTTARDTGLRKLLVIVVGDQPSCEQLIAARFYAGRQPSHYGQTTQRDFVIRNPYNLFARCGKMQQTSGNSFPLAFVLKASAMNELRFQLARGRYPVLGLVSQSGTALAELSKLSTTALLRTRDYLPQSRRGEPFSIERTEFSG
jgi:hypothetical protein